MSSFYHPNRRTGEAHSYAYAPLYYADQVNHCPGCSGTGWYLGRFTAECANCHTALPLAQSMQQATKPIFVRGHDRRGTWGDLAFG